MKFTGILMVFLLSMHFKGISQDSLPINPDTKLISVNNIVVANNVSSDQIRMAIIEFFIQNSNEETIISSSLNNSQDKQLTLFFARQSFTEPNKIVFEGKIVCPEKNSWWGPARTNYGEFIDFTITVWIKDGKYKYDFSHFMHQSLNPVTSASYSAGVFEHYHPDCSTMYMSTDTFTRIKLQSINKIKLIATALEQFVINYPGAEKGWNF